MRTGQIDCINLIPASRLKQRPLRLAKLVQRYRPAARLFFGQSNQLNRPMHDHAHITGKLINQLRCIGAPDRSRCRKQTYRLRLAHLCGRFNLRHSPDTRDVQHLTHRIQGQCTRSITGDHEHIGLHFFNQSHRHRRQPLPQSLI